MVYFWQNDAFFKQNIWHLPKSETFPKACSVKPQLLFPLLLTASRVTTCHIPGVPLEPGLGLSVDLDPGRLPRPAAIAADDGGGGGGQRVFSLSGAVLLMTMAENTVENG